MADQGIGVSVPRREDGRFVTGKGRFVDDINRPGQVYAYFLRSPRAHAEIETIDTGKAVEMPGVVAVLTGEEVAADGLGPMPCGWGITNRDGSPMVEPRWPILARGRVRFVGDMVALVVAESRAAARDAAEKIEVTYRNLPAIAVTGEAKTRGAPQIWEEAPNNVCFNFGLGDEAATNTAIEAAHHVTRLELVNQRVVPNAIEPRAALAEHDAASGQLTLHCTSQAPHLARLLIGAFMLHHPEHKFRVISPDVGGGFGSKIYPYHEYAAVCWAAKRLDLPVKWTAERSESFLSDAHGRDHATVAELALDENRKFTALRVRTTANLGAYLSALGPLIPTFLYAPLLAGQYTTPAIYCEVDGVFTNTTPVDAVRGAGRPEATYLLERLVETAAREIGMDPAELRRRNLIANDAYPYQTPVAFVYDSGDYAAVLDKALELADYKGYAARREAAKKRGRLRGIGLSAPIEATGAAPSAIAGSLGSRAGGYESAEVRFEPTGTVSVYVGTHSHGQSHATTFAQIVADKLGVPYDSVEIVEGDTGAGQFGNGTLGSRSVSVGGAAMVSACDKIIAKGKKIAAHLMEASEGDIAFENGAFRVSGTDKATTIGEIALAAYVPHNYPLETLEPGLSEQAYWDPSNFNFPYAAYVCEVEVDPETGVTEIVKFTAVDDVGNIVNPMVVHGQVQGGVVHGIGQAMSEQTVYDGSGQPVTGSYMDYCLPRADDVPMIDGDFVVTPCPSNPLGVKGVGEIGAIGAPPAVINAITDAIGNNDVSMPATAEKVWRAIRGAGARPAA